MRRRPNRFQGTIGNLLYRLRSFEKNLTRLYLKEIVMGYESRIVEMVQLQMWSGRDGKEMGGNYGDVIRPFYVPSTVKYKKRKHQPFDRVTLKDKGLFYRGMRVYYNAREGFFVKSTDSKTPKLIDKYGAEIFRLNHDNFNKLVNIIRRELQIKVQQHFLGRKI